MTENPEAGPPPIRLGLLEQACDFLAKLALVATVAIIGMEVALRNILNVSWQGTDEVSSYLVVAITFLSLATCQENRGYHELQIVKSRLSPRGRALLDTVLHVICLIAALILLWQFSRLVINSWSAGNVSSTDLRVPFWIPQLTMPLGMAAFCLALFKEIIQNVRMFRMAGPGGSFEHTGRESG